MIRGFNKMSGGGDKIIVFWLETSKLHVDWIRLVCTEVYKWFWSGQKL
jgi:hypothetical protein